MTIKYNRNFTASLVSIIMTIVFISVFSISVHAAMVPSLSLSLMNNNTQIQVTVIGADPNAPVVFYYPSTSSILSANLGMTNASGNFTSVINPVGYNIAVGASTYVMVDGTQSQAVVWPNYANQNTGTGGYLSLSQSSLNLTAGQGSSVTVSSSITNYGTLSIPSNTNPSAASVSLSGTQIVVNGLSVGSTNITVCAVNAGCATLFVNVQQSNSVGTSQTTSPGTISFSQSNVSMTIGQSQTVSMSGPGYFYVSTNSNLNIASTNVNGSILTINALQAGNTTLNVCSAGGGSTSCGAVNVTVSSAGTASNSSAASTTVYVTPNSVNLSIGQTQTVALTSSQQNISQTYYVNSNSNPSIATVNVSGTNALVSALASGGSNVSICAVGGNNCANLYVYVPQNSSGTASSASVTTTPLALASFSVSSSNVNNAFMAAGDALTFTFNFNQTITTPTVTINGSQIAVYGSNAGPYTAIYTMTGNEASPLSVAISFTNANGATGRTFFTIGGSATSPVSSVSCPSGLTCVPSTTASATSASSYSFTRYLYMGMTTQGVSDPDVTALQNRLKTDGLYSAAVTGYFGPYTQSTVEAYQTAHGLSPIGVVGPSTRDLLNRGM